MREFEGKMGFSPAEEALIKALIADKMLEAEQIPYLSARRSRGESLREVLCRLNLIGEERLLSFLAGYFALPQVSLSRIEADPAAVSMVPEEIARRYRLFPFALKKNGTGKPSLCVALADPDNSQAVETVRLFSGMNVEVALAAPQEIDKAVQRYLIVGNSVARPEREKERGQEIRGTWNLDAEMNHNGDGAHSVRLVNSLLYQAVLQNASDIHWEPQEQGITVRFRIDGRLALNCRLPSEATDSMIARLKIMAGMDTTEHRIPQDGSFTTIVGGRKIDMRVSSLPTVYGEKIVARILDPETAMLPLAELGLHSGLENDLRRILQRLNGMLLTVGPTGSGKTTTLYALLRELDHRGLNIVSIEDPVEYRIPGVNQVKVNPKTDLTFAKGVRAILRQDPDVIMIGEIRDEETARMSARAALTGHLVLSTLHTKTAAEALTRLLDMGLEPYLVGAAIGGILSQRLVLRLCEYCRTEYALSGEEKALLPPGFSLEKGYKAGGCNRCGYTGYRGRIGIHELLLYSPLIKEMILAKRSPAEIERAARSEGMTPMIYDGLNKVRLGITSLEEVVRSVPDIH